MSIPEPSINSSQFRAQKRATFRLVSREERADVEPLINGAISADWRISSIVNLTRDERFLTENVLWIWQRRASNIERSGLLLIRTGGPCLFWNSMKDEMVSLRIQIPHGFCSSDSYWLCVATICASENSLEMEDVIVANGYNLFNTSKYSQRYTILQNAVNSLGNQPFLGLSIKAVTPLGLGEWLQQTSIYGYQPDDGSVWDIQPNEPGRRRKVWVAPKKIISGPKQINTVVLSGIDSLVYTKAVPKNHNPLVRSAAAPSARFARIVVDKMGPDRYILQSAEGERLGYALVRGLLDSERYRVEISQGANVVRVEWGSEFSKYKIIEFMKVCAEEINTIVTSRGLFHEV